jgi:hypothetical protein
VAAQQPPPPQPFPRSGGSAPAPPKATPAPPPAASATAAAQDAGGPPTDTTLGMPGLMFPNGEFLESFDAGRGQRCYLFGTDATFAEVLAYYKQALKDGGRELFKSPAMQQFDLGKFQDQTMTTQPAVVVKDYSAGGYLQVKGTQSRRFATIIQIVPAR